MLYSKTKYTHSLLFLLLFFSICLFYNYPSIFQLSPRSTHQWRQCDSASIALNYYQNGMHFFQPQVHYQFNDGGYCAAGGEMPIPSYLAAGLYHLLGPAEGYYRLVNLFFLLLGLWAFSRLLLQLALGWPIALFLPAIIFTSPILAYYGFNFVPNAPALGLVLFGWYWFYQYRQSSLTQHLLITIFIFTLAGLFKISALLSFFILILLYLFEQLGLGSYGKDKRLFPQRWKILPLLLLPILAALAWKGWADHYNAIHQTSYFAAKIKPFWQFDGEQQMKVFNTVVHFWSSSYFHLSIHLLVILLSLWLLIRFKKLPPLLQIIYPLLLCGVILYGLLWFQRFLDHDYYAIDLLIYPIFVLAAAAGYLQQQYPTLLKHPLFRICLVACFLFNLHHARSVLRERYAPDSIYMEHFNPTLYKRQALGDFLRQLGIQYPTKVISFPDQSPNNNLYHLNLPGWSGLYLNGGLPAGKVWSFIEQGAEYLIISKIGWLKNEELQPFFRNEIGNFENSVIVFDLRGLSKASDGLDQPQ